MVDRVDYPLVYIIIVNWNGWQDTINCLDSLEKVSYPNFETLVVDNGSLNDSVERIKLAFPGVQILELRENLGYSGGTNQGFRYVLDKGADYILTINNDVVVDPSFLGPMVETMEKDAGIGALNPKIFYLNHPEGNVFWAAGGKANLWLAASDNRGYNQVDTGQFDQPTEVDFGTGCCLLASREALIRTGLLDAAYFIYFDDTDWSFRLRQKGLTVNYTPHARIWHAVSSSSKIRDMGSGTLSPFVHFLHARNHLWFLRSHTSYPQKIIAYPAYFARRMVFYSGAFIILRRWEKLKELWKGFWAGLKNKPDLEEI
jgi:GT2 family glycosyltransferase